MLGRLGLQASERWRLGRAGGGDKEAGPLLGWCKFLGFGLVRGGFQVWGFVFFLSLFYFYFLCSSNSNTT